MPIKDDHARMSQPGMIPFFFFAVFLRNLKYVPTSSASPSYTSSLPSLSNFSLAASLPPSLGLFCTERLIPEGAVDPKYIEESMDTPDTGSFMHLHLGIDGEGLDDLDIHYSVRFGEG